MIGEWLQTSVDNMRQRLSLALLIVLHIVICCISLIQLANNDNPVSFHPPTFHLFFDAGRLHVVIPIIAAFSAVAALFVLSGFSFGFFAGFYLYTMVLGYLWLNCFTDLTYDHRLAGNSAAVSAIAFLVPALLVTSPIRQIFVLSEKAFDRGLIFILLFGGVTVAAGAFYSFRLVALDNIYDYRDKIELPTTLRYLLPLVSSALLPFAFASFLARRKLFGACAAVLLLLALYPVTLSKTMLFGPLWLALVAALARLFEARMAVVLSLTLPLAAGVVLHAVAPAQTASVFSAINFRMVGIPSVAMDVYNDFFARHELTYFCQINVVRHLVGCPYQEFLGSVMAKAYGIGNFNASLFATEGIASVGPLWAPVATFGCGLIVALANRLSAGLPAGFVMVSAAILVQTILNVQFSTVLLTHGGALMFLLWYLTPRNIFEDGKPVGASGHPKINDDPASLPRQAERRPALNRWRYTT